MTNIIRQLFETFLLIPQNYWWKIFLLLVIFSSMSIHQKMDKNQNHLVLKASPHVKARNNLLLCLNLRTKIPSGTKMHLIFYSSQVHSTIFNELPKIFKMMIILLHQKSCFAFSFSLYSLMLPTRRHFNIKILRVN